MDPSEFIEREVAILLLFAPIDTVVYIGRDIIIGFKEGDESIEYSAVINNQSIISPVVLVLDTNGQFAFLLYF